MKTPMLIDSHAHLTDARLDAAEIIAAMPAEGLSKIVTVGFDMATSRGSVDLAEKYSDVYAAVGVHPSDVKGMRDADLDELLALSRRPKTVAFGEIGLDYHYPDTDKANQRYWLEKQLEILSATGLPAVIHLRDAYEDMREIILANKSCFKASAVMHCFSGSKETALFYASLGFYISFSGVITFHNAEKYGDIIRAVPRDRILVETDCPYLAPRQRRGRTNYPAYVRFTAEKLAEELGESIDYVAQITTENTLRLFSKIN